MTLPVIAEWILFRIQQAVKVNIRNNDETYPLGCKTATVDLKPELLDIFAPILGHPPCLGYKGAEAIDEVFREVVMQCRTLKLCSDSCSEVELVSLARETLNWVADDQHPLTEGNRYTEVDCPFFTWLWGAC